MNYTSIKKKSQEGQSASNSLPVLFPDTAGIDIGSKSHFVAVPSDRDAKEMKMSPETNVTSRNSSIFAPSKADHFEQLKKA